MKRCMYCGQENDDSADTCVKCGNPLLDVPANDSEPIEEIPDIDLEETSVSGAENECADRMETQAPGTNADTASMQNGDSDTTPQLGKLRDSSLIMTSSLITGRQISSRTGGMIRRLPMTSRVPITSSLVTMRKKQRKKFLRLARHFRLF